MVNGFGLPEASTFLSVSDFLFSFALPLLPEFEFVILILDTSLHKIAHGEPLWIWICKIIIVAILAPFHHYLEKGMAKFIESKSLVQLRQKMSFKNWWPMQYDITIPTTTTTVEDESEEDLGIL